MALKKNSPLIDTINERSKELNCLFQVDEVLSDFDCNIEDVFSLLVNFIPSGWRFDTICKVKISYNNSEWFTNNYINTELKLVSKIVVDAVVLGEITVVYIKPVRIEKRIFLTEEIILLNTIAGKISNFILLQRLKKTIKELENSQTAIVPDHSVGSQKVIQWLKLLNLTNSEIERFTKVEIKFKKSETMCKQGSLTSYIMLLCEGLSKNYLEGTQERGFNFSIVKPFDFIGLSGLYGSGLYNFSGTALTPCSVFMIENTLFKAIIANNPAFAQHIFTWYCNTTERHLKRLSSIANKQALGRIAEVLIYLKEKVFESNYVKSLISRKDIAELAAMSTESAVRILSDLKKDNIINIHGNDIEIIDEKMLKTLFLAG